MAEAVYISPEYNPHSLTRDWGLFIEAERPDIYATLSGSSLATLRHTLVCSLRNIATAGHVITADQTSAGKRCGKKPLTSSPSNVNTDISGATASTLYNDVGLDVLTLALLADVPLHRPLHLSHNSLVGHWRWLRLVWRTLAQIAPKPTITSAIEQFAPGPALRDALLENRNNIAIAHLRQMFHELHDAHDAINEAPANRDKLYSFLANLTLFCPFIGCELLCQHGLIKAPWTKGSPQ